MGGRGRGGDGRTGGVGSGGEEGVPWGVHCFGRDIATIWSQGATPQLIMNFRLLFSFCRYFTGSNCDQYRNCSVQY